MRFRGLVRTGWRKYWAKKRTALCKGRRFSAETPEREKERLCAVCQERKNQSERTLPLDLGTLFLEMDCTFRPLGARHLQQKLSQAQCTHLGANEVEVAAVGSEVDENLARAQQPELVGITTGLGTVHLSGEPKKWVEGEGRTKKTSTRAAATGLQLSRREYSSSGNRNVRSDDALCRMVCVCVCGVLVIPKHFL